MGTHNQPASRLHVFDMDGTLLRGTATVELARQMGQLEVGAEIERRWGEGSISDNDFWLKLLEICQHATPADLQEAFEKAPWMDGIAQMFADIKARGEDAIVISQSPTFFVRGLELWGASETYGSTVELGEPLGSSATLMPMVKVTLAGSALDARNLGPSDCVVYGDSSSDVELFRTFPNSVAVNPSPVLSSLAATTYVGTDMGEAYALARQLISRTTMKPIAQGSAQ
jgi:HAD superfamily phosphoserine phosphatase-like hydrolase